MSDTSRVQLYQVKETTYGTTPSSALNELRFTGETLGLDLNTEESEEIRNDRSVTDVIKVGQEVIGDVNFELSYGSYDDLLPSALWSADWPSALTITATTISAADGDNSFNDSGSGFPAFVPGQWIEVRGFTEAANNGYFEVVSRTTAKIVVAASPALTTEVAGDSVTIKGTMIRNGTTKQGHTLEKEFADITQFQSFTGCLVNTMNLEVSSNSVLKGSFGFMGLASALTQSTVGTGAANAANTNAVMNASSNVGTLREGNAPLASTVYIQSLTLQLNNQLRAQDAVSSLAHIDIGSGTLQITGNMNVYFVNNALMDKYLAGTASSLSFSVEDASGNAYIFTVPNLKFTDGKILASGRNQDVLAEMTYRGLRHGTQGNMVQIDRFAA